MNKNKLFINREISWLAFNERVLQEAANSKVPLIDRLRFLGIFSNNLDEFFRVRVASIKRMTLLKSGHKEMVDSPKELLETLQKRIIKQQTEFEKTFKNILEELKAKNVWMLNEKQLNASQKNFISGYFKEHIRPNIVPLMLNQVTTFPYLKDHSIYLAIKLSKENEAAKKEFALLEIPSPTIARFILLPAVGNKKYFMLLDDVIRFCLPQIFSFFNYDKIEAHTIKLTRDAELDMDNDVSSSFIEKLTKSVKDRQKGLPVRLVYDKDISPDLLSFILLKMKLKGKDNVLAGGRYHNFKDFIKFPDLGNARLLYPPFKETYHPLLASDKSFFSVLKKGDILLQYPYHTFSHFIDFIREVAIDPQVKSISMTLYRAARNSKVINALISAAKNGKKVTVMIELQARFDEAANIQWGQKLTEEGVEVLYGIQGMKVHAKLCLVERMENKKLVSYLNVSTGNYNEQTAHTYSDQALFTCNKILVEDAKKVFLMLRKPSIKLETDLLVLSPKDTRNHFLKAIQNEIQHAKSKKKSTGILLKMNSLVDEKIIEKLYEASKAGVKVRLIIRGICRLKAGVKGLSENIEAISIIDRFLEHSRVYLFENNGNPKCYISSADFMPRNLDVRVEVSTPILDEKIKKQLIEFLEIQWADSVKARILDSNLQNEYRITSGKKISSQTEIANYLGLRE